MSPVISPLCRASNRTPRISPRSAPNRPTVPFHQTTPMSEENFLKIVSIFNNRLPEIPQHQIQHALNPLLPKTTSSCVPVAESKMGPHCHETPHHTHQPTALHPRTVTKRFFAGVTHGVSNHGIVPKHHTIHLQSMQVSPTLFPTFQLSNPNGHYYPKVYRTSTF